MKKLVLLILLSICINVNCDNLKEIRENIRWELKDMIQFNLKLRYTDRMITNLINEAQKDIVTKSWCLDGYTLITTTADVSEYPLPADVLLIKETKYANISDSTTFVTSTTSFKSLERVTLAGLNSNYPYWESQKGMPMRYFTISSSMTLQPIPNSSYCGQGRLKVYYVKRPGILINDTDIPFDSSDWLSSYQTLIKWYVLARLTEDGNKAIYYENKYYQLVELMRKEINTKPDFQPNFSFKGQ